MTDFKKIQADPVNSDAIDAAVSLDADVSHMSVPRYNDFRCGDRVRPTLEWMNEQYAHPFIGAFARKPYTITHITLLRYACVDKMYAFATLDSGEELALRYLERIKTRTTKKSRTSLEATVSEPVLSP